MRSKTGAELRLQKLLVLFGRRLAPLLAGLCLLAWGAVAGAASIQLDLELELDPVLRRLQGHGRLSVPPGPPAVLELDARAEPKKITMEGELPPQTSVEDGTRRWALPASSGERRIELDWSLELAPLDTGLSHRDTLSNALPVADPRGSFLPAAAGWHPRVRAGGQALLQRWAVRITLPKEYNAIVPGHLAGEEVRGGQRILEYRMTAPAEGIDLIAGPYRSSERRITSIDGRSLRLRTLFHPEIAQLADDYLDALGGYFDLYERWIGPYPYDDFSVVSSPTPTGFGMPTLTYLGIEVLRLPFIRATSLGHEVLHNWWGNGVYPDYRRGNWSEGLTTFMADYHYAQRDSEDKALEMRLGWLRELSAIAPGEDRPLVEFTSRTHGVSAAVGYGKAAMVFSMLRDQIGAEAFDRGIRRFWRENRFAVADWDDLRAAFEAEAARPLGEFFEQWTRRSGLPQLELLAAQASPRRVAVTLRHRGPFFALDLPVRITEEGGAETRSIAVSEGDMTVPLAIAGQALSVALDPEFRVLRRLATGEAPPILREIQLARRCALIVLGGAEFEPAAAALAGQLLDRPPERVAPQRLPADQAALVIGPAQKIEAWLAEQTLAPPPQELRGRGDVQAWAARLPGGQPLALVAARTVEALDAARRPLPHLGRFGWVSIEHGKTTDRGVLPPRPQSVMVDDR